LSESALALPQVNIVAAIKRPRRLPMVDMLVVFI
jgi:hypothetical protein